MKKGNTPLLNGFILGAATAYLIWYFSAHGMWNPATVVVMIVMLLLSTGQIIIWFMFFRDPEKKKKKRR
ncbi:MAG: hypothetical protein IK093_17220 [Ruminiclostridium sp.]|nr:hypothetical protein [Ruminiclostridium sp.]